MAISSHVGLSSGKACELYDKIAIMRPDVHEHDQASIIGCGTIEASGMNADTFPCMAWPSQEEILWCEEVRDVSDAPDTLLMTQLLGRWCAALLYLPCHQCEIMDPSIHG